MAGILSKGFVLSYGDVPTGSTQPTWTSLTNLQSVPDMGGNNESVEVTVLTDAAHMYINGIKDYGDSIEFTFLYDKTQFATLSASAFNVEKAWKVALNETTGQSATQDFVCVFKGMPSVKLNGVGVNEALTYTLSIKPTSEIKFSATF